MYEHLDDSSKLEITDAFRHRVAERASTMRLRRRQVAAGLCAAMLIGGGSSIAALQAASGPGRQTVEIVSSASDPRASQSEAPPSSESTPGTSSGVSVVGPGRELTKPINVLLTASDSRECLDPNSPYAGAFGTADDVEGARSDTIMIVRLDPVAGRVSMLSLPRDLWVKIPERGSSRIIAAFSPSAPHLLVDTIVGNFSLTIDHYINVDFCGFKDVVEAIGGVPIPLDFAAMDRNTGLQVEAGCHRFDGDEALAYVRSRHYQFFDSAKNLWVSDGTSDLGRISRQQDFLIRVFGQLISQSPEATDQLALAEAFLEFVTTDSQLTVDRLRQWQAAFADVAPGSIERALLPTVAAKFGDASVLVPSDQATFVLQMFRDAPSSVPPTSDLSVAAPSSTSLAPGMSQIGIVPSAPTC